MTEISKAKQDLLNFGAVEIVKRDVTIPSTKTRPEKTEVFHFRELTGAGMKQFGDLTGSEATFSADTMVDILMLALCEEDGARQFTTDEDKTALAGMKFVALNAIFLVAMKVIGLTADAVEEKKSD